MLSNYRKRTLAVLGGVLFLLVSLVGVWGVTISTGMQFNVTKDEIHRGDPFKISVDWNESVNESVISLNRTDSDVQDLNNYLINSSYNGLPSFISNETFNNTWTNYTIQTNTSWGVGKHLIRINVTSTWQAGSAADNSTQANITLWGWSNISDYHLPPRVDEGTDVNLACKVIDEDKVSPIPNYSVTFNLPYPNHGSNTETNLTKTNGWANVTFQWSEPGRYDTKCSIDDNTTLYYNTTSDNFVDPNKMNVSDVTPPKFSNVSSNANSNLHPSDTVKLWANWSDNVGANNLSTAILRTNETGNNWENITYKEINETSTWSNFTWQNSSVTAQVVGWNIWANDTGFLGTSNWNDTMPNQTFKVWGWSEMNSSDIPDTTDQNEATTLNCQVLNANNSEPINNYPVQFWDNSSTGEIASGRTGSDGVASVTYTWSEVGSYNVTCNITDNTTLIYNTSAVNSLSETVDVQDTEPPRWHDPYGVNDSVVNKGEAIKFYANWSDNVGLTGATLSHNGTGDMANSTTKALSGSPTWSNFSLTVDSSWTAEGPIGWKIYANDSAGNENATNLNTFKLWGWANVSGSFGPESMTTTEKENFTVTVTDNVTGGVIPNYTVTFYTNESGSLTQVATGLTNSDGEANFTFHNSSLKTFKVKANITDNATLFFNASAQSSVADSITVGKPWKWSTWNEFGINPSEINISQTNSFMETTEVKVNSSLSYNTTININNLTTGISANYSQDEAYREISPYTGSKAEKCLNGDGSPSYDNPLLVNISGSYKNTTGSLSNGTVIEVTLAHRVVCPPGRYWGPVEFRNATNHSESVNLLVEINEPISTENELENATGIGVFNGTMPKNATTYHSYYFNTSAIQNATGIRIELENFDRDLDLFLLNENETLTAKSIQKGTSSESLLHNYLPQDRMWEIRTYGNYTKRTDYGGVIHFTTLNATNSSSNETLDRVDFGNLWPGNQTRVDVTLKNEGNLNFTDVQEIPNLYQRDVFADSSAPKNFTFLVPSSAQKVEASINWTGSSDYNISLYKPDGTLADNSSGKGDTANLIGVEKEEWTESTFSSGDSGFWTVQIRNETNVSFDSYNVTTKVWFNGSRWISSNYTTQSFTDVNNSQSYHFNFTVPNNNLAGKYKGWLKYQSDSGAALKLPIEFNVTTPELVVNRDVEQSSTQIVENIGFNRTGGNRRQKIVKINNTGNKNLTFESNSSSSYLNSSSKYMEFSFTHPSYVNPNDYGNLTINVSINTTKAGTSPGIFKGWILLNDTSAQPSSAFNLTVKVKLTDEIDVEWADVGGDGLKTADGDDNWIENVSRDENITLFAEVYYKNETPLKKTLEWNNFSAWIKERNTSYEVSSGINIYNTTLTPPKVWDGTGGYYKPNVSIPVDSQSIPGGYYKVYLRADHYPNNVHLQGTGVHDYLVVNDPGLYFNSTHPSDGTLDLNQLTNDRVNITVTNYGPVDSSKDINLTGCGNYIKGVGSGGDCGGGTYGDRSIGSPTVGGNGSSCNIWWSFKTKNVTQDRSCSFGFDTSAPKLNNLSVSLDITDTDGGGGQQQQQQQQTTCSYTSWTNQTCGGWDCGPGELYQNRTSSVSGCTNTQRCIDAPSQCGIYDLNITPESKILKVKQGSSGNNTVEVENNGSNDLENLSLSLQGNIPKLWYDISPSEISVDEGEEDEFTVSFDLNNDSPVAKYPITYKVGNSDFSDGATGELWVLPIQANKEKINKTYEGMSTNLTELKDRLQDFKGAGFNVSSANKSISKLEDKVEEAQAAIKKGDYVTAKEKLDAASVLYKDAKQKIEKLEQKKPNYLLWAVVGIVVIVIASILIYLLLPSREGYHPQKGYQYKRPGVEKPLQKIKSSLEKFIQKIKEKLGMERKHTYNYKGRKKWSPEEEE